MRLKEERASPCLQLGCELFHTHIHSVVKAYTFTSKEWLYLHTFCDVDTDTRFFFFFFFFLLRSHEKRRKSAMYLTHTHTWQSERGRKERGRKKEDEQNNTMRRKVDFSCTLRKKREREQEWIEFDCELSRVKDAVASYQITATQVETHTNRKGEEKREKSVLPVKIIHTRRVKKDAPCQMITRQRRQLVSHHFLLIIKW